MSIMGNMVGGSSSLGKTFVLVDENGVELTGVVVDKVEIFDATPNDVRVGKTYAGDDGVKVGEKVIPSYHTREGTQVIPAGEQISFSTINYDYTKLQAIICAFNSSMSDSVGAEKVAIDNKVYEVKSTEGLSDITKNHETNTIDFGILNTTAKPQVVRYIMYKEIY
jgi:hypothetical protein